MDYLASVNVSSSWYLRYLGILTHFKRCIFPQNTEILALALKYICYAVAMVLDLELVLLWELADFTFSL